MNYLNFMLHKSEKIQANIKYVYLLFRFCIHVIKNTMRPEAVSYKMLSRTRSQGSKNGGLGGLSRMSTQNSNLSWSRGASNQASTKR